MNFWFKNSEEIIFVK
jgi:hypothetical protein